MTSLVDRLRGVIRPSGPPKGGPYEDDDCRGHLHPSTHARDALSNVEGQVAHRDMAADVLGGEWRESLGQRFLVVDRTYLPGHRHGSMAVADGLPPSEGTWPRLSLLANTSCATRLLFVDLETTGIAGGAGTYAFLVGCAWFDGGTFRVRQFFLSSFAAERALLEAVGEAAGAAGTVVTYNGKSFDLPVMETRFTLHRMPTPFAELPHIDMLHPARRLWRAAHDGPPALDVRVAESPEATTSSSCRLTALERTLCGYVREGDVPGFEIPARYFRYVHSGDARPLESVLEHNRLDLLSLALVTARAAQLLDEGADGARTAREALGLGRLYERGGMFIDARACFARAVEIDGDETVRMEALRAYAVISRRMRRYDDAAAAWRGLLQRPVCARSLVREATEALAVHLEHRLRDPLGAKGFALQSLEAGDSPSRRHASEYRLARLDRKLAARPLQTATLF